MRPSVFLLLAANIPPLIGIMFFDWDLFQLLFLFWIETGIMGFVSILKMMKLAFMTKNIKDILGVAFVLVPFFLVHFGGFMAVHLFFLRLIFGGALQDFRPIPFFSLIQMLVIPIIVIFISHIGSFFLNFIGKQEYKDIDMDAIKSDLYNRVAFVHMTIMVAGLLFMLFDKMFITMILVCLKIVLDLHSHIKEHQKYDAI